jgi:hypothetical protein
MYPFSSYLPNVGTLSAGIPRKALDIFHLQESSQMTWANVAWYRQELPKKAAKIALAWNLLRIFPRKVLEKMR